MGRRRTAGRPTTWGTTSGFLVDFGIESITDLPGLDDLKAAGLLDQGPAMQFGKYSAASENDDDPEQDAEAGVRGENEPSEEVDEGDRSRGAGEGDEEAASREPSSE